MVVDGIMEHKAGSARLRRAEDVRVHAVLLGEDEGDNALRQRGLQAWRSSPAVNKTNVRSETEGRRGEARRLSACLLACWACKV
jgi:hypothetical protein